MHGQAILAQGSDGLAETAAADRIRSFYMQDIGSRSFERGGNMPHVQITWVEGRTPEQKRKIAERITTVLIEEGKAKRENIHVSFHDVPSTNYAEAGVLVVDQKRTP
jgi:4-oxalocrotonate tautomerase